MVTSILYGTFVVLFGICLGVKLGHWLTKDVSTVATAGTLVIYKDGDEAYLFLETKVKPDELAKYKDVIFKVETRNQQGPL